MINLQKRKRRSGFTMIELVISIALFLIVTSIASGGFVRALRSQRDIFALISANSNSSLSIEQMEREIRTGYNFCTNGTDVGCSDNITSLDPTGKHTFSTPTLQFVNAKNEIITYGMKITNGIGSIWRQAGLAGAQQNITANDVNISNLNFILQYNQVAPPGSSTDPDQHQTRVTMTFSASGNEQDVRDIVFNFQTTISPRQIDSSY